MGVTTATATADEDGVIRVALPGWAAGEEVEVTVRAKRVEPPARARTPEELGWPPGYFERTAGSITDPTFERGDQGEYETRDELGWPSGFLDETYGSISDDTFVAPSRKCPHCGN